MSAEKLCQECIILNRQSCPFEDLSLGEIQDLQTKDPCSGMECNYLGEILLHEDEGETRPTPTLDREQLHLQVFETTGMRVDQWVENLRKVPHPLQRAMPELEGEPISDIHGVLDVKTFIKDGGLPKDLHPLFHLVMRAYACVGKNPNEKDEQVLAQTVTGLKQHAQLYQAPLVAELFEILEDRIVAEWRMHPGSDGAFSNPLVRV